MKLRYYTIQKAPWHVSSTKLMLQISTQVTSSDLNKHSIPHTTKKRRARKESKADILRIFCVALSIDANLCWCFIHDPSSEKGCNKTPSLWLKLWTVGQRETSQRRSWLPFQSKFAFFIFLIFLMHWFLPNKERNNVRNKKPLPKKKRGNETYIFPANILSAATAENISNGVHTRKHHPFL